MTPTQVHKSYNQILSFISAGKLKSAFDGLELLNSELNSGIQSQNLESIQANYRFMLQYFMEGANDPERSLVYNKLIARLFITASQLREELLTRDSGNFEFSQKRYLPYRPQMSITELQERLNRDKRLAELEGENRNSEFHKIISEYEEAQRFLFYFYWLSTDYSQNGMLDFLKLILSKDFKNSTLKSHLVSALTLNLWRSFDDKKIDLLLDAVDSDDLQTRQRALVGVCFVLAKHNRFLPYFPAMRNRLVLMADNRSIVENLQNIIIQIIATSETDEITKKMQEEIFPELMKLSPLIQEGLSGENPMGMDEWGELNPEWQEMIENSGASDMIQELADMEMSGADVYMSTFSMLKSFPFFNEFANWFLPFDLKNSAVSELFKDDDQSLLTSFINSPAICNSDRYSFSLSVLQMPEMQRNMMKHNFSEAAEQMEEITKDEAIISPQVRAKTISKHYIQDLFRFFKLNPKRGEFSNMFKTSLLMHRTFLFELLSADDNIKQNIADFYFSKKMYPQALELFAELEKESEITAEFYQKMAYAYQQNSELMQALNCYKKADLIKPDDFWTTRKIAFCNRLIGNTESALESYRHADFIKSGNLSVKLNIVNCLADLERYEEALKELTLLHDEHAENPRLLRATMKTAFAAQNMAQAEYFAELLLDQNELTPSDLIEAGMISWATRKNKVAAKRFAKALYLLQNNWEQFTTMFDAEKQSLIRSGVEESEIVLLLDAIAFGE